MVRAAVTVSLIIIAGLIAAVAINIYFSPYQSCVRARAALWEKNVQNPTSAAQIQCAEDVR